MSDTIHLVSFLICPQNYRKPADLQTLTAKKLSHDGKKLGDKVGITDYTS